MATQLWNQEIDKTVDWGGDTTTGGQPVSGQFVQKFIKDTLASKFGYLHYNSDTKKYQVFADESDFNTWQTDTVAYGNLLLATFDAPAPATIKTKIIGALSRTVLSSKTGNVIEFEYIVNDTSNSPITESVTVRLQVTNNGITQTYSFPFGVDYETYDTGTKRSINVDDYISVGVNEITLTFIGVTTQASSVASVRYNVVQLGITSGWDNSVAQMIDEGANPELIQNGDVNVLRIPFTANGQGQKFIEITINGKELKDNPFGLNSGEVLTGGQEITSLLSIGMCNINTGRLKDYFVYGKNNIQIRIFILSDGEKFVSNTLYFDFIVRNVNSRSDEVYILYKQEVEEMFEPGQDIIFNANQYFSTSFDYSVYSSTGKNVEINFNIVKRPENEGDIAESIGTLTEKISNGEVKTFKYSFLNYGTMDIIMTTANKDLNGLPLDTFVVVVDVKKASVQIAISEDQKTLSLDALNRSNSEPTPNKWESGSVKAEFENIYWNDSAGWDGESLILNNGALCTVPYNFFGTNANELDELGRTIEITFEMINVQDEDAVMLSFEDENNKSSIRMTASEAKLTDQSGTSVHTKYNANTKIKLAFVINPYDKEKKFNPSFTQVKDEVYQQYKNCNFIIVNGILDKAEAYSGNMIWTNVKNPKLVLGNKDGKAGIKIYSIRVYNKALSLDEELTNFIAESGDKIINLYNRNKIYENNTSNVSLDIVKDMIPTAVIYGDIAQFNKLKGKKENMQFDVEFYDPTDPDRDFYARGMWFSNQGTSSLAYPIRNLRPYFSKTRDDKTQEASAKYYTEVYLSGEFTHGEVSNEEKLGHFYTNAKTCSKGYHLLYNDEQADKLQKEGVQLFYLKDDKYIPCKKGVDEPDGHSANDGWYIQAYREIKEYGKTDDTWKFLKDLRMSGCKIYKISGTEEVENPVKGNKYLVNIYEQVKGKKALKKGETYFLQQGAWKQYHKSGYTDRWTFKADYAESTMTQNAGVGRLWGDCMKNVKINGFEACRTNAQTAVGNRVTSEDPRIDIRTSCDGKPIVAFCCPLQYEEDGITPKIKNGKRQYGSPIFIGLYNIMTDKSSTKLFGFEDIYDEDGTKIYKADRTECWECLTNASEFSQGLSVASDTDISNELMADRSIWTDYEARWPDVKQPNAKGENEQVAHTHNLESMWRFVNFCKPAVNYYVGIKGSDAAVDGYTQSPYSIVPDEKFEEYWDAQPRVPLYTANIEGGNIEYKEFKAETIDDWYGMSGQLYEYKNDFDYDRVWKELSGKKIEGHIYKGKVAGFDAKHGLFLKDIQFDEERVDDETNGVSFGDSIFGSPCETDYYISVYLTQNGARYTYVDEHGDTVNYTGESIERDAYEKNSRGESYSGKTYMEYFSEKKYDYFNIPRLAAYYVYLIRFAAADQFVKNSMLTTEDGQHYYYINYDNDTVLGTRNDGNLVFHWSVNRDTYDYEKNSFCFAGPKSVLWNLLECDEDFMNQVQIVDNAMYASGVLSTEIALDMFNNKQEGSWGERMYNINEKYKYLSQWHGDDAKYLAFIHGSANQFRSWFVENRFNYYDSLWESGEYMTTEMQIRLDTIGTDGKLPMFYITAARQNKFFLSNSDGKYKSVEGWKKQLNQDETKEWEALYPIYGNSSPWYLYGCDKIKVLDFRPSVGTFDLQYLSFVENGQNWMDTKGTLMTKLLIGTSDEFRTIPMFRYTNNGEEAVNLVTVTVTKDKPYKTTTKLTVFDETKITETKENDTFIYSSKDGSDVILPTIIIEPGKYYDSATQISMNDLKNVTETGLKKTQCSITAIGSIGKLYSLEEIDIRNCYNEAGLLNDEIDLTRLNNLHVYRAIGSSITSFVPAVGAILNEVSLPTNRVTTITLDNVTFRKAENQEAELFKYTPDDALKNLTIKNVKFGENDDPIDWVEFISTWIKANTDKGINIENLTLDLEEVNITASVNWLVTLSKLNLTAFTGDVYIIGNGEDGKMTQEDYDTLSKIYENYQPFNNDSALRFTSSPAVFWSVDESVAKLIELDEPTYWGSGNNRKLVSRYYEVLHGDLLKFAVTQFPNETIGTQYYKFDYLGSEGGTWTTLPGARYPDITSAEYDQGIYKTPEKATTWNLILESYNTENASAQILSDISGRDEVNHDAWIAIYPVTNVGDNRFAQIGSNDYLYIKFKPAVAPEELILLGDAIDTTKSTVTVNNVTYPMYNIIIDKHNTEYEVEIKYNNESDVTIDGKLPIVYIGTNKLDAEQIKNNPANTKDTKVEILSTYTGVKTVGQKTGGSFKLKGFVNPTIVNDYKVRVDLELNTGLTNKLRTVFLNVTINAISSSGLKVADSFIDETNKVFVTKVESTVPNDKGVYTEIEKLSIWKEVTANGFEIPIIRYKDPDKNGVVLVPNVPVMSAKIEQVGEPDIINFTQPTVEIKDNEMFINVKPSTRFINDKNITHFDFEHEYIITGTYGYEEWDWDNLTDIVKNAYKFTYKIVLDISMIYPNKFKIVYKNDTNSELTVYPATINAKDNGSKDFEFLIIPYNTDESDEVTIDMTEINAKLILPENSEDVSLISGFSNDKFITNWEVIQDPNNINYKIIKFKLNKYNALDGEGNISYEDYIQYVKANISVTGKFKNIKNEIKDVDETLIPVKFSQSVAYANIIDECEPYDVPASVKTALENDSWVCPWYLVDVDNQYYQFDNNILQQLDEANMLNSLVGVAKRVNLGWDDPNKDPNGTKKWQCNAEQGGDKYNSAVKYWEHNPKINISLLSTETPDIDSLNVYYRALCLPLANWKISDEDLETYGFNQDIYDGNTSNNEKFYVDINKISAFFIPTCRIMDIEQTQNYYSNIIRKKYKPENIINLLLGTAFVSLHKQWTNTVPDIVQRLTSGNTAIKNNNNNKEAPSLSGYFLKSSAWDSLEPTKAFCTGKYDDWYNLDSTRKSDGFDSNKITKSDIWASNSFTWGTVDSYTSKLRSGIIDVWHHFKLFDTKIVDNQPDFDKSNIKCYIPSPWELTKIMSNDPTFGDVDNNPNIMLPTSFKEIDALISNIANRYINRNKVFVSVFNDNINSVYTKNDAFTRNADAPFIGSMIWGHKQVFTNNSIPSNINFTTSAMGIKLNSSGNYEGLVSYTESSNPVFNPNDYYYLLGRDSNNSLGLWIPLLIVK